jgi:hypothetical protein
MIDGPNAKLEQVVEKFDVAVLEFESFVRRHGDDGCGERWILSAGDCP